MYPILRETPADAVVLIPVDKPGLAAVITDGEPLVRNQLQGSGFKGKHGQFCLLRSADGRLERVLVGTDQAPEDPRATLQLFARLIRHLAPDQTYAVDAQNWAGYDWEQAVLGWGLGSYQFSRYLAEKPKPLPRLAVPADWDLAAVFHQLDAIFLARNLINTPPADQSPLDLCAEAQKVAQKFGADFKLIRGEELLEQNFPAIHAVGKGSYREAALLDLRWGNPDHPKLSLVGKGVVFDTGGLNMKPASGMILMKKDMGGAAVTLALAQLIMAEKLPVRLRLLIPAVENSPGRFAYRPSDVIATRKGIQVEIGNTDAEGRVILGDALAEAVDEMPDLLLDMATLTGACRIALGQDIPGFWTPSDQIGDGLMLASRRAADPIWRMPLWQPYRSHLKSQIADINNMANTSYGGSITAALYLYEFVKPFRNWVHFDLMGWRLDAVPGTPIGGEANALRAIFRFLKDRYAG